jgi:NTP pyrophosphatase (non-canonical NTP hydrolase)
VTVVTSYPEIRVSTFDMIRAEYNRAAAKHWPDTPRNSSLTNHERLPKLVEEVGEVAMALNDGDDDDRIIEELVQVAAMAVAWIEALRA